MHHPGLAPYEKSRFAVLGDFRVGRRPFLSLNDPTRRSEMKAITTLFVVGMFVTTVAMADDVDDVKATIRGHFDAVNSGDVAAYTPYYANQGSAFGGELLERISVEQRKNNF
jgi:hypothetical protein